jgi:hypothetical protein
MGYYLNPPLIVEEIGRKLESQPLTYAHAISQVKPDEKLIFVGDRIMFKFAGHAYSPAEFEEFASQVRAGTLMLHGLFAVPATHEQTTGLTQMQVFP